MACYGGRPILDRHATYAAFLRVATPAQKRYFVFSGMRNPLDERVSLYFKYRTDHHHKYSRRFKRLAERQQRAYVEVVDHHADFATFLRRYHRRPYDNDMLVHHTRMDDLIRFEHLQEDFSRVLGRLGLAQVRPLPVVNQTSGRGDYLDYYPPELRPHATRVFGPFMHRWGYELPRSGARSGSRPRGPRATTCWARSATCTGATSTSAGSTSVDGQECARQGGRADRTADPARRVPIVRAAARARLTGSTRGEPLSPRRAAAAPPRSPRSRAAAGWRRCRIGSPCGPPVAWAGRWRHEPSAWPADLSRAATGGPRGGRPGGRGGRPGGPGGGRRVGATWRPARSSLRWDGRTPRWGPKARGPGRLCQTWAVFEGVPLVAGLAGATYAAWRSYVAARAALLPLVREGEPTRTLIEATRPVHARTRVRIAARQRGRLASAGWSSRCTGCSWRGGRRSRGAW